VPKPSTLNEWLGLMVHPGSPTRKQTALPQNSPETGCQLNALLGGVGHFLPRM